MSNAEIGQYHGRGVLEGLEAKLNQMGPRPMAAVSEPRPPLLDEVAMLKAELRNINEIISRMGSDFDLRLQRIEATLGLQR